MTRGTTPSISIHVEGTNLTDYADLELSFKQQSVLVVKKLSKNELSISGDHIINTKLTQEDTLGFRVEPVKVQLRAITDDGTVVSSGIFVGKINEILNESILEVGDDNGN